MTTAPDQITISLEADQICQELEESNFFNSKQDAYVFAMNLAMALNLDPDPTIKATENRWHHGAVFQKQNRDIYAIMKILGYTDADQTRKGMALAEVGLRYIKKKMVQNSDLLSVLMNVEES